MALTDEIEIPKKTMVIFFIVDTSGSMAGERIGRLNVAINGLIPEIREILTKNDDVQIKIAVLQFSSGANWITKDGPVDVDKFNWTNLDVSGVTDFGAACSALNQKLSNKEFMPNASGSYPPTIFLFIDGYPTDDCKPSLDKLKQNNWFKHAIKVAIAIGDDVDRDVCKEFTGNPENVINDYNSDILIKYIEYFNDYCELYAEKPNSDEDAIRDITDKTKEMNDAIRAITDEDGDVW